MNILLVEDDDIARETAKRILQKEGFTVTEVENGVAGFAELHQTEFEAIVCDYQLPFLGGRNFYDQVRVDYPRLADRVVFVTGWVGDAQVMEGLDNTGQPYLAKPYEPAKLVDTVRKVTESVGR